MAGFSMGWYPRLSLDFCLPLTFSFLLQGFLRFGILVTHPNTSGDKPTNRKLQEKSRILLQWTYHLIYFILQTFVWNSKKIFRGKSALCGQFLLAVALHTTQMRKQGVYLYIWLYHIRNNLGISERCVPSWYFLNKACSVLLQQQSKILLCNSLTME